MKDINKRCIRNFGKRFLSLVLITALMLGLIPQSAYATTQTQSTNEQVYISGDCDITYKESSSWDNYVNVDVTIKNNGNAAINPWKVALQYDGTITNIWNADIMCWCIINVVHKR